MDITVIVVAYNEERNIGSCLDSLLEQQYSGGEYEVVVVDGASKDATADIVLEYAARDPRVRLVVNPGRTIASNRNAGLKAASYMYVAFTDADCICPVYWLERLSCGYAAVFAREPRLAGVGGGNSIGSQFGAYPESLGVTMDSYLAALGSVQAQQPKDSRPVESVACLNAFYDKRKLLEVGGFDEWLANMGEDWDVNYRLRLAGYRLFRLPDVSVVHRMRGRPSAFWKQMLDYGKGRARLMRKYRDIGSARYAVPLLFVAGLLGCIAGYAITGILAFLLPLLYFPAIGAYAAVLCAKRKKAALWPFVMLNFFIIHFGYSFGLAAGAFGRGRRPL